MSELDTLNQHRARLAANRREHTEIMNAIRTSVTTAKADGFTKAEIVRASGLARATVDRFLGWK